MDFKFTPEQQALKKEYEDFFRLEDLVAFCNRAMHRGVPLAKDPLIRCKIAQLAVEIEVGHALAYRTAWEQSKGGIMLAASRASAGKVYGTELLQRFINAACEITGLYGQVCYPGHIAQGPEGLPTFLGALGNAYQFAPSGNLAGGTSEIQRNIIAWVGLGLPRS